MTTQQTDIEKTLKRILARELKEWPADALGKPLKQANDGSLYVSSVHLNGYSAKYLDVYVTECLCVASEVSSAEWEAERARIAKDKSDFAEHIGKIQDSAFASALDELKDSLLDVKYEQELWDKVASDIFIRACDESIARFKSDEIEYVAGRSALYADAFMAERAKRIAARKANHE